MVPHRDQLQKLIRALRDGLKNRSIRSMPTHRVDERDTMFARAERVAGTEEYRDYYDRQPDRRAADDRIRENRRLAPQILSITIRTWQAMQSRFSRRLEI